MTKLTRAELSDKGIGVTRVEFFPVDFPAVGRRSQSGTDILLASAGAGNVECHLASGSVVLDVHLLDLDIRVVGADAEAISLENVSSVDGQGQGPSKQKKGPHSGRRRGGTAESERVDRMGSSRTEVRGGIERMV